MTENLTKQNKIQNVALVYVQLPDCDVEHDTEELEGLVSTAQGTIVLQTLQKRNSVDPVTVVGSGKLDEIRSAIQLKEADNPVDVVLFSVNLSAAQRTAVEKVLDKPVIDRIDLILDIFAIRANTAEGKTQVELAQLSYNLATRPDNSKLSRQGAGIGTRGPGETKLETSKRAIRDRMHKLRQQLKEIAAHRQLTRKKRADNKAFVVALVGYTNAGKSTLFNRLTNQDVYADDKLFATLDTTVRRADIDGMELLYIDTVGFINNLPHALVDAFKSTLEEAAFADLVLHVIDVSDPYMDMHAQITESILSELQVTAPVVRVYNKCDKTHPFFCGNEAQNVVFVSATKGEGMTTLHDVIKQFVSAVYANVTIQVPFEKCGVVLAALGSVGADISPIDNQECFQAKVRLKRKYVDQFLQYITF